MTETLPSPCVRNCCLDEQDVCLGCGRSLQEILDWHAADQSLRRAILQRAAQRRLLRPPPFSPPPSPSPR